MTKIVVLGGHRTARCRCRETSHLESVNHDLGAPGMKLNHMMVDLSKGD
jgi:hypothetical protein